VRVWDVLRSIGFELDPSTASDPPGALRFDFGSLSLSATHSVNPLLFPIVQFYGVSRTPRSFGEVSFQMPQLVQSREFVIALLAWHLDNHSHGESPSSDPGRWIAEGRALRHLVPGERERIEVQQRAAEYSTCPKCRVERRRARPAFRALLEFLEEKQPLAPVSFGFDGEVLTIGAGSRLIALPASGAPWPCEFRVSIEAFGHIPKRFNRDPVVIAVFRGHLLVDGVTLPGPVESHEDAMSGLPTSPEETADNPSDAPTGCVCRGEDPEAALRALRQSPFTTELHSRSLFEVSIQQCPACRQEYLSIFVEMMEFDGGNDSQCSLYVPINNTEASLLRTAGEKANAGFIVGMGINRRHLVKDAYRPNPGGVAWVTGPLLLPPPF
jgi:hypothetical protein